MGGPYKEALRAKLILIAAAPFRLDQQIQPAQNIPRNSRVPKPHLTELQGLPRCRGCNPIEQQTNSLELLFPLHRAKVATVRLGGGGLRSKTHFTCGSVSGRHFSVDVVAGGLEQRGALFGVLLLLGSSIRGVNTAFSDGKTLISYARVFGVIWFWICRVMVLGAFSTLQDFRCGTILQIGSPEKCVLD